MASSTYDTPERMGRRPGKRGFFSRFWFAAASVVLFSLSACQTSPVVDTRPTPHTLIYSYLIAHGMARGYVMSGNLDMKQLATVLMADRAALLAVMAETANPSSPHLHAAGNAIEQLLATVEPSDYGRMKR